MTPGQQAALDQRLNQHADATETILNRLDRIVSNAQIRSRRLQLIERRLDVLESIVLPDPDNRCSARPSEPPP